MKTIMRIALFIVAGALGLGAWYAFSADPHWVPKDGKAFTGHIQRVNSHHLPEGRWREAKVFVDGLGPDGVYKRVRPPKGEQPFREQQVLQDEAKRAADLASERAGVTFKPEGR